MDEELRRLERLAKEDLTQRPAYLRALERADPKAYEREQAKEKKVEGNGLEDGLFGYGGEWIDYLH